MKKLSVIGILVILALLLGCDGALLGEFLGQSGSQEQAQDETEPEPQNPESWRFIISSIETSTQRSIASRGISARDAQVTYKLVLMPTRRGWNEPIMHENVANVKYFDITDVGTYEIPISEFPEEDPSVVFILRFTDEVTIDVMGFLSLKTDDTHSIVEFPPRTEMTNSISFGTVYVSEDSYVSTSEHTLADNQGSFLTETLQTLQQKALTSNLVLMAINILRNTHEDVFYAPALSLEYDFDKTEDWGMVGLRVYSRDITSKAALFDPQGTNMIGPGEYKMGYGEDSSVQWEFRISLPDFLAKAKKGDMWSLENEGGEVLGNFDFSMALVLDELKNPIVPCIKPTYTTNKDDSTLVDSISFNWFYTDPDGTTQREITDDDKLEALVDKSLFWMGCNDETYMFRDTSNGWGSGMSGSLREATGFDAPLKIADLNRSSIGYRFTFYDCSTPWRPGIQP
ncbi:MAG: hypothetical protein RBR15_07045 [Sphaerochaeta sp.]|nr:hypothetical protein [Sphaerochaeta sp.]